MVALREKHYGQQNAVNKSDIKVGNIVLVQSDRFRDFWPLGKIINMIPGTDGIVRSVEVLSGGKVSVKTIEKLIPLEADLVDFTEASDDTLEECAPPESDTETEHRPQRRAAVRAGDLRSNLIEHGLI